MWLMYLIYVYYVLDLYHTSTYQSDIPGTNQAVFVPQKERPYTWVLPRMYFVCTLNVLQVLTFAENNGHLTGPYMSFIERSSQTITWVHVHIGDKTSLVYSLFVLHLFWYLYLI
jgi:hypothetical protein